MKKIDRKRIIHSLFAIIVSLSLILPCADLTGTEVEAAKTNADQIYEFLEQKGFSTAGIAGIMGNLYRESSYLPYRLIDSALKNGGYTDYGQTFANQVSNFEISKADFIACAKYTMSESSWKALEASGGNLNDTGKYTYAFGLAQMKYWTRKKDLYEYWFNNYCVQDGTKVDEKGNEVPKYKATKGIGDMEVQLNYLVYSMPAEYTLYKHNISEQKTTTDPYHACHLFHDMYERSTKNSFEKRFNKTIEEYNKYSSPDTIVVVTTKSAGSITDTSAKISADFSNAGGLNITKFAVIYGTSLKEENNPKKEISYSTSKPSGTTSSLTISGLNENTTYYYIPVVYVDSQPYYGTASYFVTTSGDDPEDMLKDGKFTLATRDATNVTETSADVCFDYTNTGGLTIKSYGFEIGTSTSNMTIANGSPYSSNITKSSGFINTRTITGLSKGTKYYYRPYAVSGSGKYYGATKSFTTKGTATEVTEPEHTHAGTKVAAKAATMTTNGTKAYYKCSCGKLFSDSACTKEISAPTTIYKASTVKLAKTSYTYDGNAKDPAVVIMDSKGNTVSTSNYTVSKASGRVSVGSYTYKITFKGNYSGTKSLTFKIKPKGTTQNTPAGGKKAFTAKWSKQSTTMKTSRISGYQVQYSRVSDFSSNTGIKTVSGYSKTSVTVTNLAAKKYYIRIRTYMTVNNVKYYSSWSTVKAVSIK